MPTNVNIYVPNQGEVESLKALIRQKPLILGLYKAGIQPDGNTVFSTLTELPTGGGRGYVPIPLSNDIVEDAPASSKWYVYVNSQGKAQADYHTGVLSWTFNAADVADGNSYYGVFAYNLVLPFDAGAVEIKVGDVIKGVTSNATAVVVGVTVESGTWGGGTAAGYLDIMTKTGTFQDNEDITILGAASGLAVTAGGTGYAVGDILQITQTGAKNTKVVVLTAPGGVVGTVALVDGGTGYSAAAGLATTHLTGAGADNCTLEVTTLSSLKYASVNTGAFGDALKKLFATWPLAAGVPITTNGQTFTWAMALAMATGI